MNMFTIQEKTWGNRFISKSAMDESGWSHAADLGVGLSQSFGDILGSILFTNGDGYKSLSNDNNEKISILGAYGENRLDKNDGFNIGGVYSMLTYDAWSDTTNDEIETSEGGRAQVISVFGGFSGYGVRVGFDYNIGTDLDISEYGSSSTLMSFYGNYDLSFILDDMSTYLKYESLDRGIDDVTATEVDESIDDNTSTMLAGIIFKCADGITFSPSMSQTTQGDTDPVTGIDLNFQFQF